VGEERIEGEKGKRRGCFASSFQKSAPIGPAGPLVVRWQKTGLGVMLRRNNSLTRSLAVVKVRRVRGAQLPALV